MAGKFFCDLKDLMRWDFIWPNKHDWFKAYNYCTKKHTSENRHK